MFQKLRGLCLTFIFGLGALSLLVWMISYEIAATAFWSRGSAHCEVFVGSGELILCRHVGWRWKDPLQFDIMRAGGTFNVNNAIGWRPKQERRFLGVSYVTGEYLTSFRPSDEVPEALIRATTRFQLLIIPLWCVFPAAMQIFFVLVKMLLPARVGSIRGTELFLCDESDEVTVEESQAVRQPQGGSSPNSCKSVAAAGL